LNGYAGTGTNHAGIIEFKDRWYFVYHTDYLSEGVPWKRSVQINYLYYNNDGTMKKIVQDTTGVESIGPALFDENTFYKFKARHSGKLMEVTDASTSNNATIQQNSDNGNLAQHWKIVEVERGVYQIINRNSSLALDAVMSSDNVIQYSYWGGKNQRWKITGAGNGSYYVVNKGNNRMLEVYYAEKADGSRIRHWEFNGETCQMWDIIKADPDTVSINMTVNIARQDLVTRQTLGAILLSGTGLHFSNASKVFDLTGRMMNSPNSSKIGSGYFIIHKQYQNGSHR
jgi:hypothetical protein